jgi:hypothetical protein
MTKQGEYIRYLEEQKHNLSKQILELRQELERVADNNQVPVPIQLGEEVQRVTY